MAWLFLHKIYFIFTFGAFQREISGPRGRAVDHLTALTSAGSSPALATYETSPVLLAGVPGVFFGVLPFSPTY